MDPSTSGADYYAEEAPPPAMDGVELKPHDDQQQQPKSNNRLSGLFCGVADYRTSTVVLNVVHIFFVIFFSFVLTIMFLIERGPFLWHNIVACFVNAVIAVGFSLAGLHGAMNWKANWLYVADVGFALLVLLRGWKHDWLDMAVAFILLFSHVKLTQLMTSGVLTVETFEVEEYVADGGREFVQIAHGYVVTSPMSASSPSGAGTTGGGGGGGFGRPSAMA